MLFECERKFFKYFVDDKKMLFKYSGLSFVVGVMELFGISLTYPFINSLLSSDGINKKTVVIALLIVFAFILKNIFMIFYNALQADFTKSCEVDIDKKFIAYFLYGDYKEISKISLAQKLHIINFLPPHAVNNFLTRVLNLNVNIFIFLLISVFLFVKFFVATCVTVVSAILLILVQNSFFRAKTLKISEKLNDSNEAVNQAINEPLLNIKSAKILNGEQYFYNNYLEKLNNFKNNAKDLLFYNLISPYVTEPFLIIILLILLTIISVQNSSEPTILVASYAVVVTAVFRLAPTISRIQTNMTGVAASLPQVRELVGYYETFKLGDVSTEKVVNRANFTSGIELRNVCFSYSDKQILKNINLEIKKGQFIGIAGTSGVGKTTLADIIAGLLNIESGEILVDGIKINSQKMPSFKIGYIPQDYNLISASIRENIAFGSDFIDDDRVIEVLKQAQLYDFITENFKEGIYAAPFVDSTGLSQGQKQRMAIARALYNNPDIIILDEATSSLDLKTEDEICSVLASLKGQKTIIAIAHRLSTIKNADKVVFMQNSHIAVCAAFQELINTNTAFKELVDLNNADFIH